MVLVERDKKKLDIILLILFPILSVFISLKFGTNFLISFLFFSGLPALYLSFRAPKAILRSIIFALPFSVIGGLFFDHLAVLDNSWHVPTIFPFRIFNTVPLEDLIWAFLLVYLTVIFYEHFLDHGEHKMVDIRMKYFAYIVIPSFTIFLLLVFTNPTLLKVKYFYLKGGMTLILVPTIAFLMKFPKFVPKFLKTATYFFYVGLLQELTALQLGHWSFLGRNFIGWVSIFGFRFPYEELFFWLVIFATCVLSYFEFFDDEELKAT